MKTKALFIAAGSLALFSVFSVAGCSEKTEETAETAVTSAGQDAQRNAEQAGQAAERTAEQAGQAAEGVVEGAARETQDAAQTMAWTAKAKNALIADPKIAAYNLNVDSSGEQDQVTITGTVPSAAEKNRVTQVVKKAVGANAKIDNKVTVSAP
jgi:osmotically-inducible protein OsmY